MNASDPTRVALRSGQAARRDRVDAAAAMASSQAIPSGDLWSALGSSLEFQAGAPPIRPISHRKPLPLSWAQERIWVVQQADPESVAYNLAFAWQLSGQLNVRALNDSLATIVRRHEIFRTVFQSLGDQPVQTVIGAEFEGLRLVDPGPNRDANEADAVSRWVMEESRRPFDLSRGPLLRAGLMRHAEEEHVLLLTMHHIVCDAGSLDVLFREIRDFYEAFDVGKAVVPRALPIQYADFAVWQRGWLNGAALDRQLSYWRTRLADGPPVLEVPSDRPRPTKPSARGASLNFELPRELRSALNELRRREGVTFYNIFLAAFKALLHRYTGETDLAIGSLTANRNRSELRHLIGFFANTVVMRTQVSEDMTFAELLARVRETVSGACANQDVPFQVLVRELGPSGDARFAPFFHVMFSFQSVPRRGLELPGLRARMLPVDNGTAKFDLTLVVNETEDGFTAAFEYRTELFEAATIRRMADHFQNVLKAALANPNQPLWALPILSDQERHRMLVEWNNTARDFDGSVCVHQLFERQAARTPESVAVIFKEQRLTYRELNERSNCVAIHLQSLGIEGGQLVGILMDRSPEMMIALLAVLKTGAAYVSLDPSYPKNRLTFMIGDANISALLTQSHFESLLEIPARRVVLVDRVLMGFPGAETPRKPPAVRSDPSDLMYVIYTSGSTGVPKGVQVIHRSVVNLLASMRQRPGLRKADRLLALTTISFDIAVLELFLPLTTGAQVVIAPSEMALTPTALSAEIEDRGITVLQATPTVWRLLVESGWTGNGRLKALCGGEPLPPELAVKLLKRCGELWNLYGPTETTIWSATCRVKSVNGPVPIGRPINNTQIYVVDPHLQPVPVGVEGDLFIGGDGLARGYLNRPELTSEKFIANPFGEPGTRLYRTGDRARYLRDGNLVCVGRSDQQVKIRGFRIELGEIEALLEQHPGVLAALVAPDRDTVAELRLVAYWIPRPNNQTTAADLRKLLEQRLPGYMIPAGFAELSEFPLTPNGKIDRLRLPQFNANRDCLGEAACEAPRGPLELLITQIWQEVLSQTTVGIHDDFFELGGHSLAMMQVISRLNASLRVQLPVSTFLQHPTIARLADAISETGPQI